MVPHIIVASLIFLRTVSYLTLVSDLDLPSDSDQFVAFPPVRNHISEQELADKNTETGHHIDIYQNNKTTAILSRMTFSFEGRHIDWECSK